MSAIAFFGDVNTAGRPERFARCPAVASSSWLGAPSARASLLSRLAGGSLVGCSSGVTGGDAADSISQEGAGSAAAAIG